jgi:hypothetical protein
MVRSVILHRVKDYDAWRQVYDDFADVQRQGGVVAEEVLRSLDDPNDVLVTHDFDDAASAKAFFASEELHDAMSRAGVDGETRLIWMGSIS